MLTVASPISNHLYLLRKFPSFISFIDLIRKLSMDILPLPTTIAEAMSGVSKMVAATTTMQPPPIPKPKTKISLVENASSNSESPSDTSHQPASPAPATSLRSQSLQQYRPFTAIPAFTGPLNSSRKSDSRSLEDIDIPTEPRKLLPHEMLSQSQLHAYKSVLRDGKHSNIDALNKTKDKPILAQTQILDYVYDWAAWAAEIPDPVRRKEVIGSVMGTLERVLKSAITEAGIALGTADLNGTKSGMKKMPEGDVSIQVVIKSAVKEVKGGKGRKSEGPTAGQLLALEKASRAIHSSGKRGADEMAQEDNGRDGKRQKVGDSDDEDETMSPEDEEKRDRYLQKIFLTRLNFILRKAGTSACRGKCEEWETVRLRLKDAGVDVKHRNMMLNDFFEGYAMWNGDPGIDPNEELAKFARRGFKGLPKKKAATPAAKEKIEAEVKKEDPKPVAEAGADFDTAIAEAQAFKFDESQPVSFADFYHGLLASFELEQ